MPKTPLALAALLVSVGAAVSAEAAALTRQPYLQSTTPHSTLVAFRTDTSCPSTVRYGPTGTELSATQPAGTQHLHALEHLTPGTEYRYEVEACGELLATGKRFRTAPPVGTQRVHFAAVGDAGKGNATQREVAGGMLAARPELSLALGDNAYESGTEEEHQSNLFAPLAELLADVPYFPSPGNHEYVTANAQPYLDNFHLPANNAARTERYYSFDWGFVHFVALDSMCGRGTESADCSASAQREWLAQDLAASQQPWKVVFFHHPPFSSGDHGSYAELQSAWGPLFEANGVDLVLTGHDHDYERSHPLVNGEVVPADSGGVTYLVVGSGGAALRSWPMEQPAWSAYRNNTDYGYLDVLAEGGTMTARFVTPSGETIDSVTLTKPVPPPPAPTITLTGEQTSGDAPLDALLVAEVTPADATVTWDFGDGTSGSGAQLSHVYEKPGQYTATATVRDPRTGQSASATLAVLAAGPGGEAPIVTAPPATSASPVAGSGGGTGKGCTAAGGALVLPFALALALRALTRRRRPLQGGA